MANVFAERIDIRNVHTEVAKDFGVPSLANVTSTSTYSDQYRDDAATTAKPKGPNFLHRIHGVYHSDQPHNRVWNVLFVWPDGSLQCETDMGGCGWFIDRHRPTSERCSIAWRSEPWRRGHRHMGRSADICMAVQNASLHNKQGVAQHLQQHPSKKQRVDGNGSKAGNAGKDVEMPEGEGDKDGDGAELPKQ